jgi:hypothetical protein
MLLRPIISPTNPTLLNSLPGLNTKASVVFQFLLWSTSSPLQCIELRKGHHRGFSVLPCLQSTDSSSKPPYCSVRSERKHVQKQHSSINEVASGSKLLNIYNSANGQWFCTPRSEHRSLSWTGKWYVALQRCPCCHVGTTVTRFWFLRKLALGARTECTVPFHFPFCRYYALCLLPAGQKPPAVPLCLPKGASQHSFHIRAVCADDKPFGVSRKLPLWLLSLLNTLLLVPLVPTEACTAVRARSYGDIG